MKRPFAVLLAFAALPATAYAVLPSNGGNVDLATASDAKLRGDVQLRGDVAGVGDFTGDRIPDLAVVTQNPDTVRIVHGGGLQGEKSFGAVAATVATSASRLITSVAGAGDVDGDGREDLVVGSCDLLQGADAGGDGRAWVVFGRAGTGAIDLDAANFGGFRITGSGGECLGRSVAGAGDFNKDGKADVVLGASTHAGTAGRAVVVFGKADQGTVSTASLGAGGLTAAGPAGANAGAYVAGLGDFNADGFADVGVGGRNRDCDPGLVDCGAIWVVHGGPAAALTLEALSGRGLRIDGNDSAFLGPVAPAGDVNQDGKADLAWGAPGEGTAGVILGRAETANLLLSASHQRLTGGAAERLGFDVRGGADLNADNTPDILVGAPNASDGRGKAYVLYGRPGGGVVSAGALGTAGVSILGARVHDEEQTGTQIGYEGWMGLGDVDCDGKADVLLGSSYAAVNGGGTDPGAAWVNRGPGGTAGACAPGGGPDPSAPPTPVPTTTPPGGDGQVVRIVRAKLRNTRMRVGRRPTALSGARRPTPFGTTVSYEISEPATMTFRVTCERPRGKQKKFCKKLKKSTFTRRVRTAGKSTFVFSGRIGKKKLVLGTYAITLAATDADGASAPKKLKFRVVKR